MIVDKAFVAMASNYSKETYSAVTEAIYWRDAAGSQGEVNTSPQSNTPPLKVSEPLDIDALMKVANQTIDLSRAGSVLAQHKLQEVYNFAMPADPKSELNLRILAATLEGFFGQRLGMSLPKSSPELGGESAAGVAFSTPFPVSAIASPARQLVYQRTQIFHETESVNFAAAGIIRTQDGREISFDVSLSMAREFTQISSSHSNIFTSSAANLIDPLVINFDGLGAELSSNKFHFDLDMDGQLDQISQLKSGSGYLVWDKNSDGVVNDGSELFGPSSGAGFKELAAFDHDGNGFIDEADPIYSQLRIWMQHEDGTSQLLALGEKDIGAIFVGHVSTPFSLSDSLGQAHGQVANTGVYLKESGGVGIVQEIYLST